MATPDPWVSAHPLAASIPTSTVNRRSEPLKRKKEKVLVSGVILLEDSEEDAAKIIGTLTE